MINAPEGTFIYADSNSPKIHPIKPNNTDRKIILVKLAVYRLAVICGIVSSDIRSTTPTSLIVRTIVIAMKNIIAYSMNTTGKLRVLAKSLSKATYRISLLKRKKIKANTVDRSENKTISTVVIVSMFPNRYSERLGAKPALR